MLHSLGLSLTVFRKQRRVELQLGQQSC